MSNIADIPELNVCATRSATAKGTSLVNTNVIPKFSINGNRVSTPSESSEDSEILSSPTPAQRPRRLIEAEEDEIVDFSGSDDKGEAMIMDNTGVEPAIRESSKPPPKANGRKDKIVKGPLIGLGNKGKISASIIGDGSTPPNSNMANCEHTSKTFGVDSDVVPSSVVAKKAGASSDTHITGVTNRAEKSSAGSLSTMVIDRDGTVSKNPSKSRKDNTETPYSTGVIAKGGTLLKKLSVNVVRSSESVRDPVLITDAHPSKVPAAVKSSKASRNPVSSIQGVMAPVSPSPDTALAHARTTATNKGKRRAELSDNSSNDIEMVDVPKGRHGTRVGTRKASGSTSKGNSNVIGTATNIPPVDVSSTYKEPIQQIPRKRKQRAQSEDLSDAKQPTPPVVPSDGLDISVSKHFVGYAMVNIVNPDDGDLKMVPHILQRPESVSLVKQLYENGNGATGGSGLQRTNPTMALSVLVDPTYIVTSSLTKSETGPFEQVEFTDKQGARIMTLVDGNHRKAALKEVMKDTIADYYALMSISKTYLTKNERHANRLEVSEMREDIISKGSWLVRFYNEPAIKRSEIPNATMLALTGINNVKGAHQNSPQQMLLIVLNTLAQCKDERDRDLAKRYSETLVSASNMDFKRLFSKGDELLNFLCQFWYFSSFHKLVIAPKEIIQLHQGGWAIFETIIQRSWNLLRFMCSTLILPETIRTSWDLSNYITANLTDKMVSTRVLKNALERSELTYTHMFSGHEDFFATSNVAYQQRLKISYNYFKNQMSPGASEYSHQRDRKAYSLLDMKLDALYVNGLAYGPGLLPVFPGGFPILCPTMFQSLMYIMDELDLGLNVIATMITPGIGTVLGSKSAKLSSYIHYTSGTGGILYHLNYALWRSTSGWNDMSVDEKLSTNPNDDYGLPGSYYLDKAWLDIIQLIITHRHLYIYVFKPDLQEVHESCPWKDGNLVRMKSSQEANTEQDDFIDEYVSIVIRDWRECSKREYPQPRDEPKWLASPVHNVHLLVEARGGLHLDVFDLLLTTPFDFLHPRTNRLGYQKRVCKDFMLESIWKRNVLEPFLEEPYHAPILWLLGKILKSLLRNPGYRSFDVALHLPELDLPFAPSLNVDETLYREAMRNSDIHTSYRTLTSAFQSLAKAISVRGIAGIPVTTTMRMRRGEDDARTKTVYKLHPAMASKLAALYNYTMEFGRDLWNQERIRESPNSTEESYNWLGVSSDISLHTGHQQNWNICSMRDAMVFYDINRLGIDFGRMLSNKTPTDENDKMDTVDEHDVTSDADDDDDDDDRQLNQSVTKMLSDGEGGADSSDIESTHGSGKGRLVSPQLSVQDNSDGGMNELEGAAKEKQHVGGKQVGECQPSEELDSELWKTLDDIDTFPAPIFNEKEQAKATPESDSEGKSDNGRFMKRRKVAF